MTNHPIFFGWISRYSLFIGIVFFLCFIMYFSTAKGDEPVTNGVLFLTLIFVFTIICGIVGKIALMEAQITEYIDVDYKEWDTIAYKDPRTGKYSTAKIVKINRNLNKTGKLILTYTVTNPDVPEFDISYTIITHEDIISKLNKKGW